ncbi:hypothetical protein AB0M28_17070 [Streptomyces sp. NPDC051940]|uniref:hypothetical protein n=1 Tax=Streptomyces sp. NPDC051940 TaxID=3155675 RepID=UPI0034280AAC
MRGFLPVAWLPAGAAVLVLAVGAVVLLPAGAAAAPPPPRHVVITNPGSHQATALYRGSDTYRALDEAVGRLPPRKAPLRGELYGGRDRVVTLSWLFRETAVWRTDRVYLDSPGGPWVQRFEARRGESVDVSDLPATWHRAAHPDTLLTLLTLLGVAGTPSGVPPNMNPLPSLDLGSPDDATAQSGADRLTANWWWSLPGAGAGAALALAAPTALRRRREARSGPPEDGPRQVLIDL